MNQNPIPRYFYNDEDHRYFGIEHYNWAKPFSNFFPGIAGKWGIPVWAYYVNRAQALCSMGVNNKDHAIMEFLSFNKACQMVGSQGFRTFIRTEANGLHEPFKKTRDADIYQKMIVSAHELELFEEHKQQKISTSVTYFPLPNLPFAGLVRKLTLTNLSVRRRNFELVDGCPKILPYGVNFEHVKVISRHIEGMMAVERAHGIPFFRLKQTPADVEQVGKFTGGNFYLSLTAENGLLNNTYILEPYPIFADLENYDNPWGLELNGFAETLSARQILENRTPCAFTGLTPSLDSGESLNLYSLIGYVPDEEQIGELRSLLNEKWFEEKREENRQVIQNVQSVAFTSSQNPVFDQYCQQTFLENVMRGGMPVTLSSETNRQNFYIFHRQNGDLERDYHWFILEPAYLSQGSSHYRNVLQNRRMDTWFFPQVKDENLFTLANLIQTDGYNPLEVRGVSCSIKDFARLDKVLLRYSLNPEEWRPFFSKPFTPGSLAMQVSHQTGKHPQELEPLLSDVLSVSSENEIGAIHEGFWVDHWFYLLDLIEGIRMIYPDQVSTYLLDNQQYTYYDNPDIVQPRHLKTVRTNQGYRQYGAVLRDPQKLKLIATRSKDTYKVRTKNGLGQVYTTNLMEKLLCILTNRMASLDARGVGLEMEAGKPGWCDSLNGLPGLFGSSICESLEILRACRLLLDILGQVSAKDRKQVIFWELFEFMRALETALDHYPTPLDFWQESHVVLEKYRAATREGINGKTREISIGEISSFLQKCLSRIEHVFKQETYSQLFHPSGVPYTYFINTVTQVESRDMGEMMDEGGLVPSQFTPVPVALFLEGPVHYLRVFPEKASQLYLAVKNSPLFDQNLKMYKSCEPLDTQPLEIGRIKAYADGWLENGSIYTHMEYKWLLEILKSGLYDSFFDEITHTLVPFIDPQVYGRSTFENCSFITASAFPDPRLHGQAFQPRLSGMTCEFLQMWTIMTAGKQPFSLNNGNLILKLEPVLPEWMFTTEERILSLSSDDNVQQQINLPANSFAFRFLGKTLVIYHNPERKATYGHEKAQVMSYCLYFKNGETHQIQSNVIEMPFAEQIRNRGVEQIIVELR